ncbi:MAG: hypothetical protein KJ922_04050 [Nanoarchaeota archaeon]|nr:hypothetical protein [Nanoarchaeota archaeon]
MIYAYLFPTGAQAQLFEHMRHIELMQLTRAKNVLKQVPRYDVEVISNNPGSMYTVKRGIEHALLPDHPRHIDLDRRSHTIYVAGHLNVKDFKKKVAKLRDVIVKVKKKRQSVLR